MTSKDLSWGVGLRVLVRGRKSTKQSRKKRKKMKMEGGRESLAMREKRGRVFCL